MSKLKEATQKALKFLRITDFYSALPLILLIITAIATIIYKLFVNSDSRYFIIPEFKNALYQGLILALILLAIVNIQYYSRLKLLDVTSKSWNINKKAFWGVLAVIIVLYSMIQVPFLDNSFGGYHPVKYGTYVEPALYMSERNDPFYLQRKYMHNPINDSQGRGYKFGNLPMLEWMLATNFEILLPYTTPEVATHLTMHFIGISILVSLAFLLSRIVGKFESLVTVFFFALNPIFNISTFVTVYDSLNFLLIVISFMILMHKGVSKNRYINYAIAGIIAGVAIAVKYNTIIWAIPLYLLFFVYRYKKVNDWLPNFGQFCINLLIPTVVTLVSINYFPTYETKYFIYFILGVVFTGAIILLSKEVNDFIKTLFEYIYKRKYLFVGLIGVTILLIVIVYLKLPDRFRDEFITEPKLLFNTDLYARFIYEHLTIYLFLQGLVGLFAALAILPTIEQKKRLFLYGGLIFASVLYIVFASKVIFFHSYYWLIVIFTSLLLLARIVALGIQKYPLISKISFLVLLLFASILMFFPSNRARIGRDIIEEDDLVAYVNENYPDQTVYIDEADAVFLVFHTEFFRLYDNSFFAHDDVINMVRRKGFEETMDYYRIKFIVTRKDATPNPYIYVNAFDNTIGKSLSLRRVDIIYSELYPNRFKYLDDTDKRDEVINQYNINSYFCKKAVIGRFAVFEIEKDCESDEIVKIKY